MFNKANLSVAQIAMKENSWRGNSKSMGVDYAENDVTRCDRLRREKVSDKRVGQDVLEMWLKEGNSLIRKMDSKLRAADKLYKAVRAEGYLTDRLEDAAANYERKP